MEHQETRWAKEWAGQAEKQHQWAAVVYMQCHAQSSFVMHQPQAASGTPQSPPRGRPVACASAASHHHPCRPAQQNHTRDPGV